MGEKERDEGELRRVAEGGENEREITEEEEGRREEVMTKQAGEEKRRR